MNLTHHETVAGRDLSRRIHRFTQLNMNFDRAKFAGELPDIHKDPFDRMLIAQAMIEKLTLVTRNSLIAKYDVSLLKA